MNIVTTKEQLQELDKILLDAKIIAFDFETTGLDFLTDEILGLALATDTGLSCYIPFKHTGVECLKEEDIVEVVTPHFERDGVMLLAHNLKFDIQFLWNLGIDVGWKCDKKQATDTQVMSYLLNENRESHSLKFLAVEVLKINMTKYDTLTKNQRFVDLDIEIASKYARLDAHSTLSLYHIFIDQIEKERLQDVLYEVEMPFLKVLALIERRGVHIDKKLAKMYSERINSELGELHKTLLKHAGRELNLNSGDQLAKLLYSPELEGGFGAPIFGWTKGGKKPKKDGTVAPPKPKTDAECIDRLAKIKNKPWTEFCEVLLRYKELAKIKSTYIDGLLELLRIDGKLHASFNQTVAVTGRLSCSAPNLQNQPTDPTWVDKFKPGQVIPVEQAYSLVAMDKGLEEVVIPNTLEEMKRLYPEHEVNLVEKEGKEPYFEVVHKIRDLYYNPHGILIVADYSQIEMRIMAHFSEDIKMLEAFEKKVDIHTWVSSHAYNVPYDQVSKEMRQRGKAVGFGTIYGKTTFGFATDWYGREPDFEVINTRKGRKEINSKYLDLAQDFLDDFFSAFPGIKQYMEKVVEYCRKYGFVKTLVGRKRRLPDIWNSVDYFRSRAERQAVNTKIQGSAADFIKMAQIKLERELEGTGVEQILQVHDELVFTAPSVEVAEIVRPIIKEVMENIIKLKVEITTDPLVIDRWGKAK